jgi:hypothetical protein
MTEAERIKNLRDFLMAVQLLPTVRSIVEKYAVTTDEILSSGAKMEQPIPQARAELWKVLATKHKWSAVRIARLFGFDASTVGVALRKPEKAKRK